MLDQRGRLLGAALGFLALEPREPGCSPLPLASSASATRLVILPSTGSTRGSTPGPALAISSRAWLVKAGMSSSPNTHRALERDVLRRGAGALACRRDCVGADAVASCPAGGVGDVEARRDIRLLSGLAMLLEWQEILDLF